jgi:hypothetical protein
MKESVRRFLEKIAHSEDPALAPFVKTATGLLLFGQDDRSKPDLSATEHFVECAANGHHPAASSGEQIAARLATALHSIGDDFVTLDLRAIDGAWILMQCAHGPWQTEAEKQTVFRLIAKAAGKSSSTDHRSPGTSSHPAP